MSPLNAATWPRLPLPRQVWDEDWVRTLGGSATDVKVLYGYRFVVFFFIWLTVEKWVDFLSGEDGQALPRIPPACERGLQ